MNGTKTYLVEGESVDVDEKDVAAFISKFPNSIEAKSFIVDGDTVDVETKDVDFFLKKFPSAKPTFKEAEKKKSDLPDYGGISEIGTQKPLSPQPTTGVLKSEELPSPTTEPEFFTKEKKAYSTKDKDRWGYITEPDGKKTDVSKDVFEKYQIGEPKPIEEPKLTWDIGGEKPTEIKTPPELSQLRDDVGAAVPIKHKNYIEGTAQEINNAFAETLETMDGAAQFIEDATGGFLKKGDTFTVLAKNLRSTKGEMPEGVLGESLKGAAHVIPLVMETAIAPEIKLMQLSKATNGAIKTFPKLSTVLGVNNFFNTYSQTKDESETNRITQSLSSAGVGIADGFILHSLGYGAGKIGGVVAESTKSPLLGATSSAILNGIGFAGYGAAGEYANTGHIDINKMAAEFGTGVLLGVPQIAQAAGTRAINNYSAASPELVKKAKEIPNTVEGLRNEAIKLGEQISKAKTDAEKNKLFVAQQSLNNLADVKAVGEMVEKNPEGIKSVIEADETLTPEEKQFFKDKVDKDFADYTIPAEANDIYKKILAEKKNITALEGNKFIATEIKEVQKKISEDKVTELNKELTDIIQKSEEQKKERNEILKLIQQARKERGLEFDVFDDLPEQITYTFEKIDANKPVSQKDLDDASNWLYGKYKEIRAMKLDPKRMLTTEQIEGYMEQLGKDIETLETYKTTQNERTAEQPQSTEEVIAEKPITVIADTEKESIREEIKTPPTPPAEVKTEEQIKTETDAERKKEEEKRNVLIPPSQEAKGVTEVAPEALKDVESTANALEKNNIYGEISKHFNDYDKLQSQTQIGEVSKKYPEGKPASVFYSERYHKAKAEGTNPELVKAVEELLGKSEAPKAEPTEVKAEKKKEYTLTQTDHDIALANAKSNAKSEYKIKVDDFPSNTESRTMESVATFSPKDGISISPISAENYLNKLIEKYPELDKFKTLQFIYEEAIRHETEHGKEQFKTFKNKAEFNKRERQLTNESNKRVDDFIKINTKPPEAAPEGEPKPIGEKGQKPPVEKKEEPKTETKKTEEKTTPEFKEHTTTGDKTKAGKYIIEKTNDGVKIFNTDTGKEVKLTSQNQWAIEQYINANLENFRSGKKAEIPEGITPDEIGNYIASESKNPAEIAEEWINSKENADRQTVTFEDAVFEAARDIDADSFRDNYGMGKKDVSGELKKRLKKDGVPLDIIAERVKESMELSEEQAEAIESKSGKENELIERIVDFLTSSEFESYKPGKETATEINLAEKFQELTGLPLTDATAKQITDYRGKVEKLADRIDAFIEEIPVSGAPFIIAPKLLKIGLQSVSASLRAGIAINRAINIAIRAIQKALGKDETFGVEEQKEFANLVNKKIGEQKEELKKAESISRPMGIKETKAAVKEITKSEEKKVIMTEKNALKKQIRDVIRGMKVGVSEGKKEQKLKQYEALEKQKAEYDEKIKSLKEKSKERLEYEKKKSDIEIAIERLKATEKADKVKIVTDILVEAKNKDFISQKSLNSILNKLGKAKMDLQFEKLSDMVERTIDDATYLEKLDEAKNLTKKVKSLLSGKNIPVVNAAILKHLQDLPISQIQDLNKYVDILSDIKDTRSGKIGGRKYSQEEIINFINAEKKQIAETERVKLQEELEDLIERDILPKGTTLSDYKDIISMEDAEKIDVKYRNYAENQLRAALPFVKQDVVEATNARTLTKLEKSALNLLLTADVDNLSLPELKLLNNIYENIIESNNFSGGGKIVRGIISGNKVSEYDNSTVKLRQARRQIIAKGSLNNTIEAVTYNVQDAAKLRELLVADFIKQYSDAKIESIAALESLTKKYKEGGLKSKNNFRLGIFSFLNQFDGLTPQEQQSSFKERLDRLKSDTTKMIEYGEKYQKKYIGDTKGKEILEKGKIIAEVLDKDFASAKTISDIKLSDAEKKVYKNATSFFEKHQNDLKFVTEFEFNKEFEFENNYFPTRAFELNITTQAEIELTKNEFLNEKYVNKRPTGATISRKPLESHERIYDMDFIGLFAQRSFEMLHTIKASQSLGVTSDILNSKKFKETMNSDGMENYAFIRDKVVEVANDQKNAGMEYRRGDDFVDKLRQQAVVTLLNNAAQLPKQWTPNITYSSVATGVKPTAAAIKTRFGTPEQMNARRELLKHSTLPLRVEAQRGEYEINKIREDFISLHDKGYFNKGANFLRWTKEKSGMMMKYADRLGAEDAFYAGYIHSLVKQGVIKNEFEFQDIIIAESKNPNKIALNEAEIIYTDIANASDATQRATVLKTVKSKADKESTKMFGMNYNKLNWTLASFNLNAGMSAKQKAYMLMPFSMDWRNSSASDKWEAFRFVSGYTAQSAVFQGVSLVTSKYVYGTAATLAASYLFGVSGDDKDKEKKQSNELVRRSANAITDIALSRRSPAEQAAIKEFINYVYKGVKIAEHKKSGEKLTEAMKNTLSDPNTDLFYTGSGSGMGAWDIPYQFAKDGARMALDMTQDKPTNILTQAIIPSVALAIGQGDLYLINNKLKNILLRDAKEKFKIMKKSEPKKQKTPEEKAAQKLDYMEKRKNK